jgi:hypothetical protein
MDLNLKGPLVDLFNPKNGWLIASNLTRFASGPFKLRSILEAPLRKYYIWKID